MRFCIKYVALYMYIINHTRIKRNAEAHVCWYVIVIFLELEYAQFCIKLALQPVCNSTKVDHTTGYK